MSQSLKKLVKLIVYYQMLKLKDSMILLELWKDLLEKWVIKLNKGNGIINSISINFTICRLKKKNNLDKIWIEKLEKYLFLVLLWWLFSLLLPEEIIDIGLLIRDSLCLSSFREEWEEECHLHLECKDPMDKLHIHQICHNRLLGLMGNIKWVVINLPMEASKALILK